MVLIAFQAYSIVVEKSACSTPWTAARAKRSVPTRSKLANNGISIFMTLDPISFLSINRHGKARASLH